MANHTHMPPIPPANRGKKWPGEDLKSIQNASRKMQDTSDAKHVPHNPAEAGQTANIKQNTTNKGFFKGRRIK
jgi:hypothetical protein